MESPHYPQVSVVIIAYNEEHRIKACLERVFNQTVQPDEVIVVDNNSTDRTVEITKQFRARVVSETKQGMIFARNAGFDAAQFPVIARCDADTVVAPTWIETIKQAFVGRENQILGVSGPAYYNDLGKIKHFPSPFPLNTMWEKLFGSWPTLVGPNMVLTKVAWNKIRTEVHLNDKQVHEDSDLSIHLRHYGTIEFNKSLVVYTSGRRMITNPGSFFLEYPWRSIKTRFLHSLFYRRFGKLKPQQPID